MDITGPTPPPEEPTKPAEPVDSPAPPEAVAAPAATPPESTAASGDVAAAIPGDALTPEPVPAPRSRGTAAVIALCTVVAAAAVAASIVLPQWARDGIRSDADATLRTFLDATTSFDADWREEASPLLTSVVPVGGPLAGDLPSAEALDLEVDYEVLSLSLDSTAPEYADTASAIVELRYSYELLGEIETASVPQKIWLTRPFYYGDDTPTVADRQKTASAVGPWRVTGITMPLVDDMPEGARLSTTGTLTTDTRDADGVRCFSPVSALAELADAARIDGTLESACLVGAADGGDVVGADVASDALLAAFPAIDETDPLSIPDELMRLDDDGPQGFRSPFSQFVVAGGDGSFVITVATATTDDDRDTARIIGIHPAGKAAQ